MFPRSLQATFDDGNAQNRHAGNAGDGPKHIAWLTAIALMGPNLGTLAETHSGGGIYTVASNSFCVGLPVESVLGRHQQGAGLPTGDGRIVYYGASGDQALVQMPPDCRYLAFDKNRATARRLEEVARWRNRSPGLEAIATSYAGNGSAATGLQAVLKGKPQPALVMVDPFDLPDLNRASGEVSRVAGLRVILFGVTNRHRGTDASRQGWSLVADQFKASGRLKWEWSGNAEPGIRSPHTFFLLVVSPEPTEVDVLHKALAAEHAVLKQCRSESHRYDSAGPIRLP